MKHLFPFGMPLPFYAADDQGGGGAAGDQGAADKGGGAGGAGGADKGAAGDQGAADKGGADKSGDITNALDAGGADDKQVSVPADFPADWREKMLGVGADGKVDAKRLEALKRFTSPADVTKSFFAAQEKIAKGAGKAGADEPMPDPEKDPDGAKAWRAARDIPEDAAGYKIPDDVQKLLTDEDKPIITSYTEDMHKLGMPQKFVQEGVAWYTRLQQANAEARTLADKEAATATRDTLRESWGAEFKAMSTIAQRFAKESLPGVNWYDARLPDGRALGNIPEVVQMLAKFGLAEYGDVAFAGGEQASTTVNRMAELKKVMDTNIDQWNSHAFKPQREEYYKLLEAETNRKARTGA